MATGGAPFLEPVASDNPPLRFRDADGETAIVSIVRKSSRKVNNAPPQFESR